MTARSFFVDQLADRLRRFEGETFVSEKAAALAQAHHAAPRPSRHRRRPRRSRRRRGCGRAPGGRGGPVSGGDGVQSDENAIDPDLHANNSALSVCCTSGVIAAMRSAKARRSARGGTESRAARTKISRISASRERLFAPVRRVSASTISSSRSRIVRSAITQIFSCQVGELDAERVGQMTQQLDRERKALFVALLGHVIGKRCPWLRWSSLCSLPQHHNEHITHE